MRLPRMTTRRWMVVVAVVAVMTWGGILTWRWHRFRQLARDQLQSIRSGSRAEQFVRKRLQEHRANLSQWNREHDQLLRQDILRMSETDRQAWFLAESITREMIQDSKLSIKSDSEDIEKLAAYRREWESLAKKYQYAAAHPWAMAPPAP